jgi:hypothetical protein
MDDGIVLLSKLENASSATIRNFANILNQVGDDALSTLARNANRLDDIDELARMYPSILRAVDTQFLYFLLGNNPWQEVFPIGFRAIGFQLQQKQFHIPEGIHPVRFGCFK